jgi:hypothetical protein
MNTLLLLGLLLIGAWVVVALVLKVVGLFVHLLLLLGAILFVAWAWKKISAAGTKTGT